MVTRNEVYHDLNEAFFPVEEQPIYSAERKRIPGYKTIVERDTGRPLSVVSEHYQLVRNKEAYDLAGYVVKEIFEGKTLNDFMCYNIHMPKSMASCRIDLIIPNNFNNLFGNVRESWTPFVRISNSYNKALALKYEIGFCRWICKNGVIFGHNGVTFSVTHNRTVTFREMDTLVAMTKDKIGTAGSLWRSFEQKMEELRNIQVLPSSILEIFCRVFDIKVDKEHVNPIQKEGLKRKVEQITRLGDEYFNEMGDNAYAMMNVLTDYASFPVWPKNPINYIDGYQHRVGRWVDDIIARYKIQGFDLSKHIGYEYRDSASYMKSLLHTDLSDQ